MIDIGKLSPEEKRAHMKPMRDHYFDILTEEKVFQNCQGANVLEIGPLIGDITRIIEKQNPDRLVTVEPDPSISATHNCTYNDYVDNTKELFDVVVCMGVLYHLHSPFDMIDKMLEVHKPSTIILETMDIPMPKIYGEDINKHGNAWGTRVPYTIQVPMKYYYDVLERSNYTETKRIVMKKRGVRLPSKKDMTLVIFERK